MLLLARRAARVVGPTVQVSTALTTIRRTADQAGLDQASRRANLHGAMRVTDPRRVRGRHVLVVDDAADTMVDPDELADVLERLREHGLRVGLLHRENPARLRLSRKPLLPRIRDLLDSTDDVIQVHPEEHVEAAVMWIRCPEALSVGRPPPDVLTGPVVVAEPRSTRTHRVKPAWSHYAVEAELETWGVPRGSAQWLTGPLDEQRVHHLTKEAR